MSLGTYIARFILVPRDAILLASATDFESRSAQTLFSLNSDWLTINKSAPARVQSRSQSPCYSYPAKRATSEPLVFLFR